LIANSLYQFDLCLNRINPFQAMGLSLLLQRTLGRIGIIDNVDKTQAMNYQGIACFVHGTPKIR